MSIGNRSSAPRLVLSLLLVSSVWSMLLVCQRGLGPSIGQAAAVLASFALATALVLWVRGAQERPRISARGGVLALGALAGASTYPVWVGMIAQLGHLLGLHEPVGPVAASPLLWLGSILLAPVFEEILYREQLLLALREYMGPAAAVVITSIAFAISHVEPWAVLGTFVVGLGLGTVMCVSKSVEACIGVHAGLNLAAGLLA